MSFLIRRKILISMLVIGCTLLGYVSYRHLPVELTPNAEFPLLIVQVSSPQEVDPRYMENQAIIPLEGAIGTLQGIERMDAYAEQRRGMIFVYYSQHINMKHAYLRLQEKVNGVKSSLPEGFVVTVVKVDTEQLANQFMGLQVRGGGGIDRVRHIVDQEIVEALESIDGIANVEVLGGRQKAVEIILDEAACRAYGITAAQIRNLVRQHGRTRTFVGQVYESDRHYFVHVAAEYDDLGDLENLVVRRPGPILLKDVADVFVGVKEETSISRVNGKDAVTVQLVRDARVNQIHLSHVTKAVIEQLNARLKARDIEIVIQSNVADDMEKNIQLIVQLALMGGGLAVVVLWIFLRNFRLVVTIVLAIPISIFAAFNFFYAFDISINSLTLIGMALVVGMLLDNSVVVLENIYRHASHRADEDAAVIQGTREVWRSILAATLTTMVVFLPFVFSSNPLIKLFGHHISVSVVSTLLVSLAVALLLIPMISHYLLTRKRQGAAPRFQIVSRKNRLLQIYTLLLKSTMRLPVQTILGAFVLFLVSVLIALAVSLNVSREVESVDFNLYVTMPGGATLESTDRVVEELEKRLEDIKEKQDVISSIYEEEAVLTVKLRPDYREVDNRSVAQIKSDLQERIDDFRLAEVSFEQPQSSGRFRGGGRANPGAAFERMLGMGAQTEKILVKGQDFDRMRAVAEDIQYYLEDVSSVGSVRLSISGDRPEIHLLFDTPLMSQYDVSLGAVATELSTFQREFSSGWTFKQGTEEYDITLRYEDVSDRTIDDLRQLQIPGSSEDTYELQQLSRIIYSSGMSSIQRVNQEKQIEIAYQFLPEVNSDKALREAAHAEITQLIASLTFPTGIAVEQVEEESELQEFYFLLGAAVVLIYMILASVFESLWIPFVILFSIPFAAVGSFGALILTGNSLFNANTLTGFLILFGIVVNNGILLIDYTRVLQRKGVRRSRALIMAGGARIRPILITVITTMVAMLPLAMGKGTYISRIGAPFAITVMGGLALSTLLTLVFIPTVYTGLETLLTWIRGLPWRIKIPQGVLLIVGGLLIYFNVDSPLWKGVDLFLLLMLIPAVTYLLVTSLSRARVDIIGPEAPITIRIQNLVKIYDQDRRFVREWKKGARLRERAGVGKSYTTWRDFGAFIWQVPLLIFLIYFVYFHVRSPLWLFILSHGVYFGLLLLWKPVHAYLDHRFRQRQRRGYAVAGKWGYVLLFWGFPLCPLILFVLRWHNIPLVIFIALIWYSALAIYTTSHRLHREQVNINRLTGRLAGIRRRFYRMVQFIPVIGRKKNPFRALDGISLDIRRGMFGLLGPNGAGKTTLMRIICGILEQSYGKVWINGIDTQEKREELQGLIGYLPQEFGTYENMTAYEFLSYQAILKNIVDKAEREKMVSHVLSAVHMVEHKNQKISSFSGGMKQRIGIAQILLHLPRILVVDEPTAGLDPRERIRFRNLLVELSRERVVIFSTHIIEDISSSCDRVAVLNRGKLRYLGEPTSMAQIAEGRVWQFYVPVRDFESVREHLLMVHHMRDGEQIRVRCVSENKPFDHAIPVRPSLEDAYLWLLRKGT